MWPLVLLLFFRIARRGWRTLGTVVTISLGLLSSILMALLFHPGGDPSRVYFGTDTRLFDLMAGATWRSWQRHVLNQVRGRTAGST